MSSVSRTKGQIYCPVHLKKKLVVLCQECQILICQTCMLNEHLGHPGHEIHTWAVVKYYNIDHFIKKVEGTIVPKIRQNIQDAELDASTKEKDLNSKINKAYEQEDYLHQLITDNRIKTVTLLKSEIDIIHQDLSEFLTNSVILLGQLKTSVTDCKDVKRSDNDIQIIDEANELQGIENLPVYRKISTSTVIFGPNPVVDIEKAYGKLVGQKNAVSDPVIIKSIELSDALRSLEVQKNGMLWCCITAPLQANVFQIDLKEEVKKLDIKLSDIAVHPQTDQIYGASYNDNCVYKYSKLLLFGYKFSVVFKTELKPWCLAILQDGRIVIGFFHDHLVGVYTEEGTEVKTIAIDRPDHISVYGHWGCCRGLFSICMFLTSS